MQPVGIQSTPTQTLPQGFEQDQSNHSPQAIAKTRAVLETKPIIHEPPLRVRPIEDPDRWFKLLEGNKKPSISQLYKKVLARLRENVDPSTLADLLAMCDDDPARLATVLSYGKAQSRKQRARLDSMLIDEVNQLLEADHGDKINAGLNTAKAMSLYTTDGDLLQELRNTYYTNIIGKRSINALFNAMVDLLGESELATSMVVMQKALTDDLLSSYPSTRPTPQITALMSDASLVTSLSGLFGLCRDLHKKVNQVISAMGITTTELTRRVVNMTTSSFYLRELQRLNTDCIGQDPLKQLVFLNYFFPMLKKLPDILWPDIQQRNNTLLSVLRYMDQQTRSVGDFQFVNTADKQQQAVKNKLVMQAGVPVIEEAS